VPGAPARDPLYRGYHVPAESISSAVWLYSRSPLSHRDSEDPLAARFLRRVLDGEDARPRVVVTDTLASYPPARRRVLPSVEHRRHMGLNIRAEHSHRPVRKRERVRQRFTSHAHVQRVLEPFCAVQNHFRPRRHLLATDQYRQIRAARFGQWLRGARLPRERRGRAGCGRPDVLAPLLTCQCHC